jgi:hypothetical protein
VFAKNQIVLVDTNAVLEAHRVGCWVQLSQYFALHTVEKVVEETQNGFQNRDPEETIHEATVRGQFKHIAAITDLQRTEFALAHPSAVLDDGERDLVIYAGSLTLANAWLLNGPDIATVRHAHARQWLDRLVSLEEMNTHLKLHTKAPLRTNHQQQWLSGYKLNFQMGLRK